MEPVRILWAEFRFLEHLFHELPAANRLRENVIHTKVRVSSSIREDRPPDNTKILPGNRASRSFLTKPTPSSSGISVVGDYHIVR
jgi:hypothetical protein